MRWHNHDKIHQGWEQPEQDNYDEGGCAPGKQQANFGWGFRGFSGPGQFWGFGGPGFRGGRGFGGPGPGWGGPAPEEHRGERHRGEKHRRHGEPWGRGGQWGRGWSPEAGLDAMIAGLEQAQSKLEHRLEHVKGMLEKLRAERAKSKESKPGQKAYRPESQPDDSDLL